MKKFSILATLIVALLGTSPLEAIQATSGRVDLVTIDVRDKDLAEVLSQIGEQVGVNIVVDPQVSESVTLSLDAIGWHDALEIIARQTNCVMIEQSDRLIRFTQPPSLNIEFQDAELTVVLDLLAKQSGANIVIAEDVEGKVSLILRDVPWREALETIVKTAGYVVVSERSGISEILRIVSPDKLIQQQETRIYRLRYVRPPEQYIAIISDIDKQAGNVARDLSTEAVGEFTLLKALRSSLSPGGEMDFDVTTNSIIVKDIAPRLDEIEEIIKQIDVEPALVQIEVKFISTTSNDILEAGLKFDNPNTPGRDGFRLNAYGSSPLSGIPDLSGTGAIIDPALGPVFPGSVVHNGGTWPFDIGNMQSIGVPYQALGILDFTQTQLLLSMVKDDENSKIIQQPFLTTLDNHPSTIFVGEEVPFAVQNIQQDQNGNVTVSIDENPRSPVNVGFTLYVSPHVIPDTDMIDMCVIPKVSTLVGNTSDIPGFDRFRFSDPGSGNSAYIDIPHESSQTVVTYLRVRDGQTAVIGGLHTERRIEIESGIPLLSSIPYLGELFKWRRRQSEVDHLLILVTPRILKSNDDTDDIYKRALLEAERWDYFSEKYGDESEDTGDSDDSVGVTSDAGAAGQG